MALLHRQVCLHVAFRALFFCLNREDLNLEYKEPDVAERKGPLVQPMLEYDCTPCTRTPGALRATRGTNGEST